MKTMLQETRILAELSEIFKREDIKFRFPVGPYRVDMYLPAYNIVVECDEHGYPQYKDHEDMRVHYIEDAIGCFFVRYNPDDKCFGWPIRCLRLSRQQRTSNESCSITTGVVSSLETTCGSSSAKVLVLRD